MKTAFECTPLNALDCRTVAVQLMIPGREQLLVGRGMYEQDDDLGRVLRIKFPLDEDGEILLTENDWAGEVLPGDSVGCDYLVRLN